MVNQDRRAGREKGGARTGAWNARGRCQNRKTCFGAEIREWGCRNLASGVGRFEDCEL